jgi:hypothetical protein
MSRIPDNPDALLTRQQAATALTESGFPISPKTLATMACRGGGPPFHRFGPRVLYQWGSSITWAKERLSPVMYSTSEADAAKRHDPPFGGVPGAETRLRVAKHRSHSPTDAGLEAIVGIEIADAAASCRRAKGITKRSVIEYQRRIMGLSEDDDTDTPTSSRTD